MAADPRAGERVYQEIKQAILSGELKLRQRLDIDALASRWRMSATPVRQALAVLTAERLVSVEPARGYHVAFWSERELRTLYGWRWQLARLAAEVYAPRPISLATPQRRDHARAYIAVMQHLETDAHDELKRATRGADERLSAAIRAEPDVLPDAAEDILGLLEALSGADRRALQTRLRGYFRRRIDACAAIRARAGVNALPTNGD